MTKKSRETLRSLLPRNFQTHRIVGGPLRGQSLVTSWHDYPAAILGRTEGALLNWFEKNTVKGETWLDVGAHFGYTALALSKLVGPAGRVFAFEPIVSTAGCLAQSRQINGLSQLFVIPTGLGQPESFTASTLPVTRGMADSTLTAAPSHEQINIARFDWLWPRICGGAPRIDGVKIDVQGMEFDTISGMAVFLRRFRPKLAVEFHRDVDRNAILECLREVGYKQPAVAIEPAPDEVEPRYLDDKSYAFIAPPRVK